VGAIAVSTGGSSFWQLNEAILSRDRKNKIFIVSVIRAMENLKSRYDYRCSHASRFI